MGIDKISFLSFVSQEDFTAALQIKREKEQDDKRRLPAAEITVANRPRWRLAAANRLDYSGRRHRQL